MKKIFLVTLLLFSGVAVAGANPVQLFEEKASKNFTVCTAMISINMMSNEATKELRKYGDNSGKIKPYKCEVHKEEIKRLYKTAKQHLKDKSNKDGLGELKKFYAYWLTTMDTVLPDSYESNNAYERRITKRGTELQDKANLLKIEADY